MVKQLMQQVYTKHKTLLSAISSWSKIHKKITFFNSQRTANRSVFLVFFMWSVYHHDVRTYIKQ